MGTSGLQRRFAALNVIVFSGVCLIAFLFWNLVTSRIIHHLAVNYAIRTVNWQTEKTESIIGREVALACKLADSPLLHEWCRNEADPKLKRQALDELNSYRNLFRDKSYFFVVNQSGHYYYNDAKNQYHGRELSYTLNPSLKEDSWYFNTLRSVNDYALNVDRSAHLQTTKAWINVVIKDGSRKLGMAGSGIDLTDFLTSLLKNHDPAASAILFDDTGAITAHRNMSYVAHNTKAKGDNEITIYDLLATKSSQAQLRSLLKKVAKDPGSSQTCQLVVGDQPYLAAVSYMPSLKWYDLVLIKTDALFSLRQFMPILGIMVCALLVMLLCTAVIVQRLVLVPLARLTESAQEISKGQYDVKLPEDRSDEIGVLTQSFNQMSGTIKTYTENLEHLVEERTQDLQQANILLEESNKQITDSISYAKFIQRSVLPSRELLDHYFKEHFTIWLPRDTVGGDAYFAHEIDGNLVFALVDCTGHGVPGALMAMSASALLLHHLTDLRENADPAAILHAMNRSIRTMLGKEAQEQTIPMGMEMGLCYYLPKKKLLIYSGSKLSLWVRDSNGVREIRGERQGLGYDELGSDSIYRNHQIVIQDELQCYLSTDGWLDQSGDNTRGRGFGRKAFIEMLISGDHRSMTEQSAFYQNLLQQFQGQAPQRDDITFVGFKL